MKTIIYIIIYCILIQCVTKNRYIDVDEKFQQSVYGPGKEFYTKDSTYVLQQNMKNYYKETIIKKNSPYTIYRKYEIQTKKYIGGGKDFYGCSIGMWKEYDTKGNIVKKINHDEHFPFSIKKLAKKMAKEYNIDIMNPYYVRFLSRGVDNNGMASYTLGLYCTAEDSEEDVTLIIDGKTGEIKSRTKCKEVDHVGKDYY
jgi:hypothetical protein